LTWEPLSLLAVLTTKASDAMISQTLLDFSNFAYRSIHEKWQKHSQYFEMYTSLIFKPPSMVLRVVSLLIWILSSWFPNKGYKLMSNHL